MTRWLKHLASILTVIALLGLTACSASLRVKTHPDPEDRMKAMRDVLQALPDDQNVAAEPAIGNGKRKKAK